MTLDTNVYVSALNFASRSSQLLGMCQSGVLRIDISDAIEKELVRVLREDFRWDGYRLHFMVERLRRLTRRVYPSETITTVEDPDDNRILECAVAGGSTHVLSNDKALLRIGEYRGIPILTPHEFLNRSLAR